VGDEQGIMKIAVVIATYQRPDGKTPFYLRRAIDSVLRQDHKDRALYVIGDCYDSKIEFDEIMRYYGNALFATNLEHSVEREMYKRDKIALWCCGGQNAYNIGTGIALKEGYDYICHLDHDDHWKFNHLSLINIAIERFKADFVFTRATYKDGSLPNIETSDMFIPQLPIAHGMIKSSVCYNHRTIPMSYCYARDHIPADADLWTRMVPYINEKQLVSYFVNVPTCIYEQGNHPRGY
jgi:glycosyltransferase involved in cell wall biosynthesis